ncbi:MAG: orotidine-5'-phosphate decarboxylase [Gemmatimonadetes bacterium]|nr:orotidine-5'-phosphate decarboxylase [Gemmatimonadota bacterium]
MTSGSASGASPSAFPTPIVALDVPTMRDAQSLVDRVGPRADFYKVGLQLFTREGPAVVEWLIAQSKRVFLDLKLHDIPNTVRGATQSAAALGVDLVTVHAIGGEAMQRAAVEGAGGPGARTGVLAVTVLTSFDDVGYAAAVGSTAETTHGAVLRFAGRAVECGARGVVCAGAEAAAVRAAYGDALGTLVPGIRMPGGDAHDQSRVVTPAVARGIGATWVILGRAVTSAADPARAYADIVAELGG